MLAHKPGAWVARQNYPEGVEFFETTMARRPSEIRRLGRAFRELQVDVIHSHKSSAHFFSTLLALSYSFPKVATCHIPLLQPYWRWNDRVIAPSASTEWFQRWVNLVPKSRIDMIPYFIDGDRLRPEKTREFVRESLEVSESAFLIICAGNVCERKNQLLLLEALSGLKRRGHDAVVALAGGKERDYMARLSAFIAESGIESQVRILGNRGDLPDLFGAADCFCLPSNREIMPIACLEAMAAGLPVVMTETGGIGEFLENGLNSMLVPRMDRVGLINALEALLIDKKLRERLATSANDLIASTFSPEVCVHQTIECYHRAIRRHSGT